MSEFVIIEMMKNGVYEQHHFPGAVELDITKYMNNDLVSLHVCSSEQDQERFGTMLRKMRDELPDL